MEPKKAIGIMAGVGVVALAAGLIIGYVTFDDSAKLRQLTEEAEAARQAGDEAVNNLRDELTARIDEITAEKDKLASEMDKVRKETSLHIADLNSQLNMARNSAAAEKELREKEVERLTGQVKELQARQLSGPRLPEFINRLNKAWPAYIAFSLRALELKNALNIARIAPPDLSAIKRHTREILDNAEVYAEQSREILQHVRLVRAELRKAGMEPDALERKFSPEIERIVQELADIVRTILEKTVSREVAVEATTEFADVGIKAEPGDLVFFSARGSWQMSQDLPISGQDGWNDIPNHIKVAPHLRGGALICKVGVSDSLLRAYGDMPVPVKEEGLLRLGINDRRLGDNIGRLDVTVLRIPGAPLTRFEKFWEEKLSSLLR